MIDATDRLNSGHCANFLQHHLIEIAGTSRGRLFCSRNTNHHRQHTVRIKTRVHMLQRKKAADHEPRPREQHHSQSKFGAHKKTAQAVPSRTLTGAALPFLQCVTEVDRHRSPGRGHAERQASKQGDAKCKQEHIAINADCFRTRYVGRSKRHQNANTPHGQQ